MSPKTATLKPLAASLLDWYKENGRKLPWRTQKDPYKIWVSEVMLQQTTVTAVIPYFEKFIARFPKLENLARAHITDVLEHWAGLGYYNRARNLHKAAKEILSLGEFPKSHDKLLELPGFGPYTSRAVSSIAFDEPVGVVDGNVIRVLSRLFALEIKHWTTTGKSELQKISDGLASHGKSSEINQAIMDLGSQICIDSSPRCVSCPWLKPCQGIKKNLLQKLPLKKPKRQTEIWVWNAVVVEQNGLVALTRNNYAPFLKGQWLLPGTAEKSSQQPKKYDFKHAITHHNIFGKVQKKSAPALGQDVLWVSRKQLSQVAPFSILQKALKNV